MYEHFLLIYNLCSDGTRIAVDFTGVDLDMSVIKAAVAKVKSECGNDTPLYTHYFRIGSDIKSIEDYDPWFKGVIWLNSIDEFIEKIKKDRKLSEIDEERK